MKKYINSNGAPITFNGRTIMIGDTIRAWFAPLHTDMYIKSVNELDEVKNICRDADKVELLNR